MMLRRWFTLLMIAMLPIMAMAQSGTVYPIDLSVMMTPPYGPCLKEYVGSDRINIQALLKDFTKKSDQFVVELKVTDNRNRVVLLTHFGDYQFAAGRTFTYPMGPNADQGDKNNVLHQLFENAKIQPKNECFEEGSYIFTFQAFDAHSYHTRKIALSMPFSYPVFLQGNSVAPLQIYPYENEVLCPHSYEYTAKNGVKRYATQLGGIAYQWQSANPTGMRVGYLLQVVSLGQIGDRTKNNIESEANSMFDRVDRANYTVNVLSYSPFYNHPFTMGNYEEGNAYAWRVFALTGDELNEGENANVKGKDAPARVFYFCGAPGIEKDDYEVIKDDREFDKNLHKVKMDTVKSTDLNALALWRDSSVKDAYCGVNVEIRKKGQEKWTPYFVEQTNKYDESIDPTDNSYTFTNLSYNTRYEVRAQYVKCKECAQRPTDCVYAPYSDILEFVIAQPIDSATCGDDLPKLADCGEGVKAPRILAGDTIIANGTKVVVDSVSYPNASDSSIISGKGHICMPIVKNIQLKMEFDEITINCAKELVKGKIVSVWDDKTCAMIDIDELGGQNSTGGTDNTASDATVEEYDPSTANDKPAGTLMVDKDGTVKFKTKDGKIEDIGKSITLSAQEYQSKDFLSDNAHYIEFYNEDKNNAFDNNAQGYYDKISKYEYFDSPLNKVVLPWLANNPGKIKKIKAREVKKKETIASFESVMFVIPSGDSYIQLDAKQDKDGNYELQIPGWADVDYSTPIYAIARNSAESSYFDAGKMMQANYVERMHKLNIVSLIGDLDASYKTAAEKALNSIYGRVGVTWTVELTKFDNDSIKNEILKDGLSIAADDESCWKKETREMKAIRKLYQNSVQTIDKDAAYLFVVNHPEEDKFKGTEGDMPRSQSVGYIFKDNVTDASKFGRLVAHEIGHGVYKFQHTFDYGVEEKSTDNLMDYNNDDFLAHYQWRVMQDSVMFVWGLFQDDEDGMAEIRVGSYCVILPNAKEKNQSGGGLNKKIDQGLEIKLLSFLPKPKNSCAKIEIVVGSDSYTKETILYTDVKNLERIVELSKEKIYVLNSDLQDGDLYLLPYSNTKVDFSSFKCGNALSIDAICGNYSRIKTENQSTENHSGTWILNSNTKLQLVRFYDSPEELTIKSELKTSDFVELPYSTKQSTFVLDESKCKTGSKINIKASCGPYLLIDGSIYDGEKVKGGWVKKSKFEFKLTKNLFDEMFPGNKIPNEVIVVLDKYKYTYGLDTPEKLSHFLGQCYHESGLKAKSPEKVNIYTIHNIICTVFYNNDNMGLLLEKAGDPVDSKKFVPNEGVEVDWAKSIRGAYSAFCTLTKDECDPTPKKERLLLSKNITIEYKQVNLQSAHHNKHKKISGKLNGVATDVYEFTPFTFINKDHCNSNEGLLRIKDEYFNNGVMDREKVFNVIYACKSGNKGISTGDGYKFTGRGSIQLTGRASYEVVQNHWIKEDLKDEKGKVLIKKDIDLLKNSNDRDLIANNSAYAVLSALIFWRYSEKKLNDLCTGVSDEIIKKITKKINGGLKGIEDRTDRTNDSYKVIKVWFE